VTELLLTGAAGEVSRTFADRDGWFTLRGVPPGSYLLTTINPTFVYPEVRRFARSLQQLRCSVQCSTVQCRTVQCRTVQYGAVRCSAAQWSAAPVRRGCGSLVQPAPLGGIHTTPPSLIEPQTPITLLTPLPATGVGRGERGCWPVTCGVRIQQAAAAHKPAHHSASGRGAVLRGGCSSNNRQSRVTLSCSGLGLMAVWRTGGRAGELWSPGYPTCAVAV
jgi:hypothetical protein